MRSNKTSVTTWMIIGVVIFVASLAVLSQGIGIVTLPGELEVGLDTKMTYLDGTFDVVSSKLSLGSILLSEGGKGVERISYTPYITSGNARTIDVRYGIIATDSTNSVILTKDTTAQVVVAAETIDQKLSLPPFSVTAQEILSSAPTSNINLMAIVTIDGRRMQSEIITFSVTNSQGIQPSSTPVPGGGGDVVIPSTPPVLPTTPMPGGSGVTPQPSPTSSSTTPLSGESVTLTVVEISGGFS